MAQALYLERAAPRDAEHQIDGRVVSDGEDAIDLGYGWATARSTCVHVMEEDGDERTEVRREEVVERAVLERVPVAHVELVEDDARRSTAQRHETAIRKRQEARKERAYGSSSISLSRAFVSTQRSTAPAVGVGGERLTFDVEVGEDVGAEDDELRDTTAGRRAADETSPVQRRRRRRTCSSRLKRTLSMLSAKFYMR